MPGDGARIGREIEVEIERTRARLAAIEAERKGSRGSAERSEVLVVDYVDELVPMLARMAAKRRMGYRALGYTVE